MSTHQAAGATVPRPCSVFSPRSSGHAVLRHPAFRDLSSRRYGRCHVPLHGSNQAVHRESLEVRVCVTELLGLHTELFEVQVALDAAQDVVADLVVIPQIDDRVALGLDHRVANGAVLDQLLLGSRGSA